MTFRAPGMAGWAARGVIFLIIAAVAILFQVDRAARVQPALAALVPAGLGGFSDEVVARQLAIVQPHAALDRAKSLLRNRPIEAVNLSAFAVAAAEADQLDIAGRALTYAAQRGWRDPYTQLTVIGSALTTKNWEVAAQRVDALAKMRREKDAIFGALGLILADENGRREIAKRMPHSAPLVADVSEFVQVYPDYGLQVTQTFRSAQGIEPSMPCDSYARVTRVLLGKSQGGNALAAWPSACRAKDNSIGFNLALADTDPFAWSFPSVAGISVREGEKAGLIDVRNRDPLRRQFALRHVVLTPGPHRLTLTRSDEEGIRRPSGGPRADALVVLRCDRSGGNSGSGALINQPYDGPVEFTVPADCPVQFLALTASQGRMENLGIAID